MGRFGALLRILKPPYDVSHEKLGWDGMNFCIFRELYFAECFEFGFLRFGLSQNSNFGLYCDLTAQSGKPDETPWVISSKGFLSYLDLIMDYTPLVYDRSTTRGGIVVTNTPDTDIFKIKNHRYASRNVLKLSENILQNDQKSMHICITNNELDNIFACGALNILW